MSYIDALKPFAAFADALNEEVPDGIAIGIYADGAMRFGPGHGTTVGDMRKARSALIEARAAAVVKPLDWRYYPDAFPPAWDAATPFGRYSIEEGMAENTEDPAWHSDALPSWSVWFASALLSVWGTPDEAKAAAHSDFNKRVGACLSLTPTEVAGAVELRAVA